MACRKVALAGLVMMATVPTLARAQVPGLPGGGASSLFAPGASAAGGASAATTAAPAAASAQPTLCGFLGLSKANLAGCKAKFCASPFGSLANNALGPFSTLTGGLIPQCCPSVPSNATIAALAAQGGPNGAEAVAAKVKQDEADAKARRAAIRYLSTVDCHYWPEAELAIISGLRDDRNECVRYEAALALLNGCCCNARTVAALTIAVTGSEKDGKPAETSERVRCAALAALQGCLLRYTPPEPAPPESPTGPEPAEPINASLPLDPAFRRVAYYYKTLAAMPERQVFDDARRTAARMAARPPRQELVGLPGERSVYHAVTRAMKPRPAPSTANRAEAPVAPISAPAGEDIRPIEPSVISSPANPVVVRASAPAPSSGRRGLIAIIRGAADPGGN